MGQALYRSYRSRSFDEVVGQDHITSTLKTAIKSGRISHAYLFTGPRGVGKTSVARILAHEVNNLAYDGENVHLDIIEIDAASNRRIDEIRDLREKVNITPSSAKYKVYIIDEVHMLTREAFNALLKTLEEPPAHCIFILATTESHKLPETIISRTQRFNFKPINNIAAVNHLNYIATKEKIKVDTEALELIADYSEGSFRDSISTLEQLSSVTKNITADEVRKQLGLPSTEVVSMIIGCIEGKDPAKLLNLLKSLDEQDVDSVMLSRSVAQMLRVKITGNQSTTADFILLRNLIEIPASLNPSEALEIALLEAAYSSNTSTSQSVPPPIPTGSPTKQKVKTTTSKSVTTADELSGFNIEKWDVLLNKIKGQAASLYTALRLATPTTDGSTLYLHFEFPLHQKKLNQAANKTILSKALQEITGKNINIECLIQGKDSKSRAQVLSKAKDHSGLATISNIFGNAEVLESS